MKVYYMGLPITQIMSGGGVYYKEVLDFLEKNCELEYWDFGRTSWSNRKVHLGLNSRAFTTVIEATLWGIKQLRKTKKEEVIFLNSFYKSYFFLFVWFAKYVYRRNLLLTANEIDYYYRTPLLNFLDRIIMKIFSMPATVVVVNSEATKEEVAGLGISPQRIKVIYPRLDLPPEVDKSFNMEKNTLFNILFVGYCNPIKEIHVLVDAIGRLKYMPLHLHLVGEINDGEYFQSLQTVMQRFGIKDQITFYGKLVGKELSQKYAMADILVVPGQGEGYGRVTIEAMHFGLPVIGANRCGSRELITNGVNGLLFEGGNSENLAKKILKIYKFKNTEIFKKMSKCAREISNRANFDNEIGEQFLKIIRGIYQQKSTI